MDRRGLMVLLGGAAMTPLLAPWAFGQGATDQPPNQTPAPSVESPPPEVPLPPERARRLGVLTTGDRRDREALARLDALQDGLAAKGWTHGQNLQIEARLSDERGMVQAAKDLVGLAADILVAADGESAKA